MEDSNTNYNYNYNSGSDSDDNNDSHVTVVDNNDSHNSCDWVWEILQIERFRLS
jgi:hypothetical protein